MRVAFRVDASREIGIGHARRCLALAQAFRSLQIEAVFVARDIEGIARGLIESRGFTCRDLPAVAAEQDIDARRTMAVLSDGAPDWVVVDHYDLDARWHDSARAAGAPWLAAIDDLANRPLAVDLLIDHNLAADPGATYLHCVSADTRQLRGPRFALIDPIYATAPKYAFDPRVRSLGIFMGGADAAGISLRVLEACRGHAAFSGPIEIATTSANPRLQALRLACESWPSTSLAIDQPDLAAFFARHDLQIGAGGGASWERCCLGAPTLAMVCADNQREVVTELARHGLVAAAPSLEPAAIGRVVASLIAEAPVRRRLHEASIGVVDGHGSERVALVVAAPSLTLRPAKQEDATIAFEWRNHPTIRAVSANAAPLDWDAHQQWWKCALTNPSRQLLIGHCGGRAVGVLRFDLASDESEVSIYLDPALTGLGIGRQLLGAGLRQLQQHAELPSVVLARVRPDNAASQALFRTAGFKRVGDDCWKFRPQTADLPR